MKTEQFIRRMNQLSGLRKVFATKPSFVAPKLVHDFAHEIPTLVKEIGQLLQSEAKTSSLDDFIYPKGISMPSVSFYRPDCIITEEGIKVLEFNIDYGSCSVEVGLELNRFYSMCALDSAAQKNLLFDGHNSLVHYLCARSKGKRICLWDIGGRQMAQIIDRNGVVELLKKSGLSVCVAEEEDVLQHLDADFIFRYFAYPHFFSKPDRIKLLKLVLQSGEHDVDTQSVLLDSKLGLAKLYQQSQDGPLAELVNKYMVPTLHVNDQNLNHVLECKDNWVLKKGSSFQGKDVYVGRSTSKVDWHESVMNALTEQDWIAQKFIQSKQLEMQVSDGENTWIANGPHVFNGLFINNNLAGCFLRQKIINSDLKIGAVDNINVLANLISTDVDMDEV